MFKSASQNGKKINIQLCHNFILDPHSYFCTVAVFTRYPQNKVPVSQSKASSKQTCLPPSHIKFEFLLMQMKRAWNIIIKRVGKVVCVHRNVCEAVGAAVCACDIMCVRTCGSVLLSAVWLTCIWAWGNKRSRGRGGRGGTVWDKAGGVCDLVGSGWMGLRSHGVKRLESHSGPSPLWHSRDLPLSGVLLHSVHFQSELLSFLLLPEYFFWEEELYGGPKVSYIHIHVKMCC